MAISISMSISMSIVTYFPDVNNLVNDTLVLKVLLSFLLLNIQQSLPHPSSLPGPTGE